MKALVRMVKVPLQGWNRDEATLVTMEVREGEFVLLLGNNGSGKSSLLNLISGLSLPESGEVFIKGIAISRMSEHQLRQWRSRIGMIPSDPVILEDYTIEENLQLTAQLLGKSSQEAARNARECAALCGLEPELKRKGSELSVGLKKRLVIARSLVNQPELILADSPMEALDNDAQEEFLYICTKLAQIGYPIVMTSSYPLPFEIRALRVFNLNEVQK